MKLSFNISNCETTGFKRKAVIVAYVCDLNTKVIELIGELEYFDQTDNPVLNISVTSTVAKVASSEVNFVDNKFRKKAENSTRVYADTLEYNDFSDLTKTVIGEFDGYFALINSGKYTLQQILGLAVAKMDAGGQFRSK
jgi:hypothetical protein